MPIAVSGGINAETGDAAPDARAPADGSSEADKAEAMAAVMIETFGARALDVVQSQVYAAAVNQPLVAASWTRIADLIRDRCAAQDDLTR